MHLETFLRLKAHIREYTNTHYMTCNNHPLTRKFKNSYKLTYPAGYIFFFLISSLFSAQCSIKSPIMWAQAVIYLKDEGRN